MLPTSLVILRRAKGAEIVVFDETITIGDEIPLWRWTHVELRQCY